MKKATANITAAGPVPGTAPGPACRGVLTAEEVLEELSDIAAARPEDGEGPPVKVADKLKALEMLRKYHEQAVDRAAADGESLTIRLEVLDGTDA